MLQIRKYKITGMAAIGGRQHYFTNYVWATGGKQARALTVNQYYRLAACSTVQIHETDVVPDN